ncbi:N,N'-diacetylchitobiose phosphorylase [Lentisphaera profundi]|uniref:N,N'-diacetylchitobiose phosphorylase n=1 Tax=Lentisphaera profundi TaxID=1658616 RepID=A0ABY7VWR6_9BACT|nr:N,N'-diacetylchitobiose phosphorylase [Lentisphaera profundi]WDE98224.1 N,N'-diacetylchitobiose phosphorylase [Lentisphaera profundi]
MKYGYFDDQNKEYVIEKPDTPSSWSNYLGSTRYGAIITNNAGGYSFFKSVAQGRFTRLRFNAVPMDQAGRYIYIHDAESKDYWSTSWQPVAKPLDQYKSECRHGSAYTKISSDYSEISTETTFFVPLDADYECWSTKVKNKGSKRRTLKLFTYVEYGCNWNAGDDLNNLQYSQYITNMNVVDSIISHASNVNLPEMPDDFEEKDQARYTFLGAVGVEPVAYDTDREAFLGPYRTYANPIAVEKGQCSNSLAKAGNPCGTLQFEITLEPGEEKDFAIFMGIGRAEKEGKAVIEKFANLELIDEEFNKLKNHWHSKMSQMSVQTPDSDVDSMLNMWSQFNSLMTFFWSRAASLVYSGARDGLGYRDTVQDMLGVMHAIPELVQERLELMITGQVASGGAMPVVKPFAHRPGFEKEPTPEEFRSDDALWLFNAVPAYVKETGDLDFYHKVLPYADKGEGTILQHLRQAIEFSIKYSGAHGFPCGMLADWNDCLELGQEGETVFVAFQLRYGLKTYIEICELLGKLESEITWAQAALEKLDKNLHDHAWDGEWFLRAYRDDGLKFGSKENDEGSIFLNTQTWSVLSGHASEQEQKSAMDAVHSELATDYGVMLCAPPFVKTDYKVVRAALFNPGLKENAAIFTHTQGWTIMAEAMLGRGDRAFDYYKSTLPAAYNDRAELRQIEPYVYCQSTISKFHPLEGASRLPWLTGAATWAFYAASQYIIGIQPDYHGLTIDPCIPSHWDKFQVSRQFRGATYQITVTNPNKVNKGIASIKLNGEIIAGQCLPLCAKGSQNSVEVIMG